LKSAIVLLGYGSPDSKGNIMEYLRDVYGGKEPPEKAIDETLKKYSVFDYVSPSTAILENLRRLFQSYMQDYDVFLAYKHWKPSMQEIATEIIKNRYDELFLMPLFPIRNRSIMKSYNEPFMKNLEGTDHVRAKALNGMDNISELKSYWAESISKLYSKGSDIVIFTAHSLPFRVQDEREYYMNFVTMSAEIAENAGIENWTYAFQSRGFYGTHWLEPSIQKRVQELNTKQFSRVDIVPIGFFYDHLEVLYDMDTLIGNKIKEMGIEYRRVPLPNDSMESINILKKAVEVLNGSK
jgi:ferrochelatase